MRLVYSASTHIGKVRENNEDNLYVPGRLVPYENADAVLALTGDVHTPCVFAVCDGMGGQEHGEYASYVAAGGLAELEAAIKTAPTSGIDGLVQEYVEKVNNTICVKMREKSVRIGTTLALVIVTDEDIMPYNIGDSRIYAVKDGELIQVSKDHTLVMQKVNMGILTKEEARHDRDRNKLTRYLGMFEDEMVMEAEPSPPLSINGYFPIILASDGLTDMVEDEKIKEVLQSFPAKEAVELLVASALERGGKDNISCIVINKVGEAAEKLTRDAKPAGRFSRIFAKLCGGINKGGD